MQFKMFAKSTTTISSLIFFLFIQPQIAKAQHIHELPDFNSIPDPTIFLKDPILDSPGLGKDDFLDGEALEILLESAEAYNNRGIIYYQSGEKEKALADFNQAIIINPNYAKAYYNRGVIYSQSGEKQKALADFNQAIKFNPNDAKAYANRGILYAKSGEKEKALDDYNQAIKLNPDDAQFYANRGLIYFDFKNSVQGKKDLEKAASLFRRQGDIQKYQIIAEFLEKL